jgi:hypothetical protein
VKYEALAELRAARAATPPTPVPGRDRAVPIVPAPDPLALPTAPPSLVESWVSGVRAMDRDTLDAFVRRTWRTWHAESLRLLALAVDRRRAELDGE